ncbi:Ig domain-containing protein [Halobacteriovorax sp. GB3]|uniref:Ig domain-containing protein n=1 Tax=Halobacteriovorax sp. GB3 TaxID=2719615 RepID=UPI00235ECE48|nr:Ig domain-containing protein [Halobacteriovorax sp. GB3]MDD0854434.1 Ig domain-containing protein [Halobacteriovorax sp. GB3]
MKTINGIISTLFLVLLFQGCMPDSLTKFKEDPVTKQEEGATDDGPDLTNCDQGIDPVCTPPIGITYPLSTLNLNIYEDMASQLQDDNDGLNLSDGFNPSLIGGVDKIENYLSYSISPDLFTNTGLGFNTKTGEISGSANKYSAQQVYTITLKHSSYSSPVATYSMTIGTGTEITDLQIGDNVGTNYQLSVTNTSAFYYDPVTPSNSDILVSNKGSFSRITDIDPASATVNVSLTNSRIVKPGEYLDNSKDPSNNPIYVTAKAEVREAVILLETGTLYSFFPTIFSSTGVDPNSTPNEGPAISFHISPGLPPGLSLDSQSGAISGTPTSNTVAQTYTYSAFHSGIEKTTTTTFKLKVGNLNSSNSFTYNNPVNGKLLVKLSDPASFISDASSKTFTSIASNNGLVGQIDYLNGQDAYVTVTTSGPTFTANEPVDNRTAYVAQKTTTLYSYTIYETGQDFTFSPTLDSTLSNLDDEQKVTYTVSPNLPGLATGVKFLTKARCIDTSITSSATCSSGTWVDNLCARALSQVSCTGGSLQWYPGGTITGASEIDLIPTEFTITATGNDGTSISTNLSLAIGDSPKNLTTNRNTLLQVNNASIFGEGDYVTSRDNAAIGIVMASDTVNNLLEVKIIKGRFTPGVDIDNHKAFGNAATFVTNSTDAIVQYNAKFALSNTTNFSSTKGSNDIYIDATNRGVINKIVSSNVYVSIVEGDFLEGSTVLCAAGCSATISSVSANNLRFSFSISPSASVGDDFNSTNTKIAQINEIAGAVAIASPKEGVFQVADSVDFANYYVGPADGTVSTIETTPTFYTNRGEDEEIRIYMDSTNYSDTKIDFKPTLPTGITVDQDQKKFTGSSSTFVSKTSYTIYAYNQYGYTTHTFDWKVNDHVTLKSTTSAFTYNLHKAGFGHGNSPCRILRDELDSTNPKEIDCYLDAGEQELYSKGLETQITFGNDMCQFIEELPYFYYSYQPGATQPTNTVAVINEGESDCYNGTNTTYVGAYAVGAAGNYTTDHLGSAVIVDPKTAFCSFNYKTESSPWYPDCDTGQYGQVGFTWAKFSFRCMNAGSETSETDAISCYQAYGACSNTSYDNYDECVNNAATWTTSATHNDPSITTGYSAAVATQVANDEMPAIDTSSLSGNVDGCYIKEVATEDPADCGGKLSACVSGALRGVVSSDQIDDANQFGILHILSNGTPINSNYGNPFDNHTEYRKNTTMYLANFYGAASSSTAACLDSANPYKINQTVYTSPNGDANATHMFAGTRSIYKYSCKNGAGDDLGVINLFVRDWDVDFKVSDGVDEVFPTRMDSATGLDDILDIDSGGLITGNFCATPPSAGNINNTTAPFNSLFPETSE